MKKKITRLCATVLLLSAGIAFPTVIQAQRVNTFTVEQQARIDSLKQGYIKKGVPADVAERRATSVVKAESQAKLRSRLATPTPASIWVDRDPDDLTAFHPIYHNYTPEQYVKRVLLKNPAAESAISNVTFRGHNWNGSAWTGDDRSLHYFENGKTGPGQLGIERGLLLATGPALLAEGPNSGTGNLSGGTGLGLDPDLGTIIPAAAIRSGSILEFDFVPYTDRATFDFVFASEEYGDYSNNPTYNDVFGFFVSKVGVPGTTNIARFPNDSAVSISNSNWGYRSDETSAYYAANPPDTAGYASDHAAAPAGQRMPDNSPVAVDPQWHQPNPTDGGPYMEYDGQTVVLTAVARNLTRGERYHLKLAICNKGDDNFGAAVFLANLDLGTPDVRVDQPYMGAWDSRWDRYGEDNLYTDCAQSMTLKFRPDSNDRKVTLSYLGIASKENIRRADGSVLPDTVDLAAGDSVITIPFKVLSVPLRDNGKEGGIMACIVGGGCDTLQAPSGGLFKFFTGIKTRVEFIERAPGYAGVFKLNITGGSNYVFRSIDKGIHWELARNPLTGEERPFTADQMDYFKQSDRTVWLREPNACAQVQFYHFTMDSLSGPVLPNHPRLVRMPEVSGLVSSYAPGIHYVNSGSDLTFRVMPTGANAGKVPVVETGRKSIPDKQGVRVVSNGDGTYTVTIYRVREAIDLRISFAAPNSNVEADGSSIYTERETLYVTSPTANTAKVYNVSGVLVRTLTLSADETVRTALPAGFYVVALGNGNTHKVIVK